MTLPRGLGFFPGRIARQMLASFGYRFIADELPARGISAGGEQGRACVHSSRESPDNGPRVSLVIGPHDLHQPRHIAPINRATYRPKSRVKVGASHSVTKQPARCGPARGPGGHEIPVESVLPALPVVLFVQVTPVWRARMPLVKRRRHAQDQRSEAESNPATFCFSGNRVTTP